MDRTGRLTSGRGILGRLAVAGLALSLSGCVFVNYLPVPPDATPIPSGVPMITMCGTYEVVPTDQQPVTPDILGQALSIIEARINATGVDFHVQTLGTDEISVQIADTGFTEQLRSLIRTTGRLDFIPVPSQFDQQVVDGEPLPPGMDQTPIFSGNEIASAAPSADQMGQPAVSLTLKETGARLFDEFAADNVGRRFAIVLDGTVMAAPVIRESRFNGQAQISGNFTVDEMNNLVTVLKYGSLPLEIREVGFSPCASGI